MSHRLPAQRLISASDKRHQALTDFDVTTCMNTTEVLTPQGHHQVDLIIPQKQKEGIITVYYSQGVNCAMRQVLDSVLVKQIFKHVGYCLSYITDQTDTVKVGSSSR